MNFLFNSHFQPIIALELFFKSQYGKYNQHTFQNVMSAGVRKKSAVVGHNSDTNLINKQLVFVNPYLSSQHLILLNKREGRWLLPFTSPFHNFYFLNYFLPQINNDTLRPELTICHLYVYPRFIICVIAISFTLNILLKEFNV